MTTLTGSCAFSDFPYLLCGEHEIKEFHKPGVKMPASAIGDWVDRSHSRRVMDLSVNKIINFDQPSVVHVLRYTGKCFRRGYNCNGYTQ